MSSEIESIERIAVIGLAGRFPGAADAADFWRNLRAGVESITFFSDEELRAAGVPAATLADPAYVKARGVLDGIQLFDAAFFGMTPREAELTDPQHRLALECAWQALEDAGCDPARFRGRIGLFAGASPNGYLQNNLLARPGLRESVGALSVSIHNRTDHLAPHISYKLDLRGPSLTVQTACSTSLVAVHLACQSLLSWQCDMALAGGVSVRVPHHAGHFHQVGSIYSPDGHCRAFDANAQGIVVGNGAGMVVLKRLSEALADGDPIRAVLRGSAVNNDGALKVGYTAPGLDGQAEVIADALAISGVDPDTVSYVEAHGTGTPLGDPIEVEALTRAFRAHTRRRGFCAIGSVKTNIGHLDAAAGVTGLIKTVLALENEEIPPTLHFEEPNPRIDFAASPFQPAANLLPWQRQEQPRRAAVSSFGFGGTNAHVVLEEAPAREPSGPARPWQLLLLSARTTPALEEVTTGLARYLRDASDLPLADVAWTLQTGRRAFERRRAVVCRDVADAVAVLDPPNPRRVFHATLEPKARPVVFLFPGQGAQHAGMAAGIYETEPAYRREVDRCCDLLAPHLGIDLRALLFPAEGTEEEADRRLAETHLTQPALFTIEYALARLWMEWGIRPAALLGHSVGEYVAACLSGVFLLEDALGLVALRGRLMQELPAGAMLAVPLSPAELEQHLDGGLSLAAVNRPSFCVVSGPVEEVEALERRITAAQIAGKRLRTSHAFHSAMMDPILDRFTAEVARVERRPPEIPYLSNLTGTWIRPSEAMDPGYWARHLRSTVRFSDGLRELFQDPDRVLLEVGPGQTLSTLARLHPFRAPAQLIVTSLALVKDKERLPEPATLLATLGRLWLAGVEPDWAGVHSGERRHRVRLPSYPFERRRYWIDPAPGTARSGHSVAAGLDGWFWAPLWKQTVPPAPASGDNAGLWLLFLDEAGLGECLAKRLEEDGRTVIRVTAGERFECHGDGRFAIHPGRREDYEALLAATSPSRRPRAVHLWSVDDAPVLRSQELGFHSLVRLAQALGGLPGLDGAEIVAVSTGLHAVTGSEAALAPEKATLLGPCRVIPQEYPGITCRSIDLELGGDLERAAGRLRAELDAAVLEPLVAWRGATRWVQEFVPAPLPTAPALPARLRERGVYLLTGGLGGLGLEIAGELARRTRARLALLGRSPFPPREEWDGWLAAHGDDERVSLAILRIREMEEAGADVLVLSADVADAGQMRDAVARARARFGPIQGVIHAAGVPASGVIQLKTPEAADAVLAPKVAGTRILAELLADEPLDFLLLFSSRSAFLGGRGQVDYCAANAFLDAFAHSRAGRPGPWVAAIDWNGWRETGMRARLLESRRHEHAQRGDGKPAEDLGPGEPTGHPLLETRHVDAEGREVYVTSMSPRRHWVLADHRIFGRPVMPGVGYLEMARAAVARHAAGFPGGGVVELRDVFFLSPLVVGDDEVLETRLVLENDDQGFRFRVVSHAGDGWREHCVGRAAVVPAQAPRWQDLDALVANLGPCKVIDHDLRQADENLGPRWQTLRQVLLADRELVGTYELPDEIAGDLDRLALHPGLLDRATGGGGDYLLAIPGYLPFSYTRLRVLHPMPRRFRTHVRQRSEFVPGKETITFDVLLLDGDGRLLVEVEGFTQKKLPDEVFLLRAGGGRAADEAPRSVALPDGLPEGISSREGIEVFLRILAGAELPQIVVSPEDLTALVERARTPASVAGEEAEAAASNGAARPAHSRPDVSTPYIEPREGLEKALAAIWQEILGIEQVGADDHFLELGGDSVQAIQVILQAQRLGLRLTPQQLFESPTIASLARLAGEAAATAAPTADGDRALFTDFYPAADGDFSPAAFPLAGLDERSLSLVMSQLQDAE